MKGRRQPKGSVSPSSMHVEVCKGRGNWQPWRVRLVGGNGEILNVSEGYYSKWNATRAARRVYPNLQVEYRENCHATT